MDDATTTFRSRHGSLIFNDTGVTLKRSLGQALRQPATGLRREVTIPYSDLTKARHHHMGHKGYLSLETRTTHTQRQREIQTVHFDGHEAHVFQRAHELLLQKMAQHGPDFAPIQQDRAANIPGRHTLSP